MKKLYLQFCLAAVFALFHSLLFLSPWGEMLEMRFLDLWFHIRGPAAPPVDVVVVAMDEESYGALGISMHSSWPRETHAALLERLKKAGARKVVFDVLFLGASADSSVDQKLAEAIRKIPTVLGADYGQIEEATHIREGLLLPTELLREAAQKVALVGLPEEAGTVRRFLTQRTELTRGYLSLAEAALDSQPDASQRWPGPRDMILYYGPPRTIPTYSYYQALESEFPLPAAAFQNKIVFVGLGLRTELGPAQKDAYLTPYSKKGRMFGVEIHATAAANLMSGEWIRRESRRNETGLLAFFAFALVFVLFQLKPVSGGVSLGSLILGWPCLAYLFFKAGIFIPGAALCLVVLPTAYLGSTLTTYWITKKQERRLERAFQFYLSPEMAREVARNPQFLQLGGQKVEATALFSDIEGFTTLAESMPPERVASLLNAYFTEVMNVIFEKKGTLIKFIGDAVFALWGTPIPARNHAQLACESALAIQAELEKFNRGGRFPPLKTRIGIHTGPMVVGNLGSARRFDFTAVGDTVNLASRLEQLNKEFGTCILVSEAVKKQIDKIACVPMGEVQVAGKKEGVNLFALLCEPLASESVRLWEEALAAFRKQQWDLAAKIFSEAGQKETLFKKASEIYLEQIKNLRTTPP